MKASDPWERVSELFADALEREGADRERFLADLDESVPDLAAEVRSLLDAHGQTGVVDTAVPQDFVSDALAALPPDRRVEERVGAFRVVRTLGTGGMGAVYLGERSDADFEQRVALKFVRRGFDSPDLRDRFLSERRILARLQHPNIARLVDGGVTEDGVPYFAMEYVDGVPLHGFSDDRRLGIDQRLRLFLQICAGVEHAHRQLVVHRDLKPANVFVTNEGNVKLLDFGVAKLLEAESDTATPQRTVRWLTPEYASPEQIRGEPVTTACDVYALGVILYELLTGHRPYDLHRVPKHEIGGLILERDPERPSTAVSRTTTVASEDGTSRERTPAEVAAVRGLAPDRLKRRLAGDLDTIVLKAMHKEPARRYGTVQEMASDIRNHLDGRPVSARPDSWRYRAGRFVRRNRVPVALAGAAVVALVSGLLGTFTQARRAAQEATRAQEERDRAALVSDLLVDMFRLGDPVTNRGEDVTAREVLDRGAARIRQELGEEPELQADLLVEVGQIYDNLGLFEEAAAHFERARDLLQARLGPDAPEAAAAQVRLAHSRVEQGRVEEGRELARASVGTLSVARGQGRFQSDLAEAHTTVGLAAGLLGDAEEASESFAQAVALFEENPETEPTQVAHVLFAWAGALHSGGDFRKADSLFTATIATYERAGVGDHPEVAAALQNLGTIRAFTGAPEEAERMLRRAVEIRRSLYGEGHPAVAESLTGLASTLQFLERLDEAAAVGEEALMAADAAWGPGHVSSANTRTTVGAILRERDGDPRALQLLEEAGAVFQRELGPGNPRTLANELNIAQFHVTSGQWAEARNRFVRARGAVNDELGPDHAYNALIDLELARIAYQHGPLDEAWRRAEAALDLCTRTLRPDHRFTLAARQMVGRLQLEAGDLAAAVETLAPLREVSGPARADHGPTPARTWTVLSSLALAEGRAAEADSLASLALAALEGTADEGSAVLAEAQLALGAARLGAGRADGGALLTDGLEGLDRALGAGSRRARAAREWVRTLQNGG